MSTELPFKISIPDAKLDLLRKKLELVTFPDEIADAAWDYGAPLNDIRRLVSRWKDGFDWRKQEEMLNAELPQFTRDIEVEGEGILNVHYVHKRSDVEGAIPLLFVHGWPGSFVEVRKLLPLLTTTSGPSFHIVAIGLPGYGFSEAPRKRGFSTEQYAEVCHKLMLALGYIEYVTQGGDWGFTITWNMAQFYGGKHVKAWHINFLYEDVPRLRVLSNPLNFFLSLFSRVSPAESDSLAREQWYQRTQLGYFIQHATQPQTLGYSLTDSPVGLLAWIYEKLITWTDAYPWTDDEILAWISIYWFSRAGPAASLRIYYEHVKNWKSNGRTEIPLGVSYFPIDIRTVPRSSLVNLGKVVFESQHASGGHFAAYEKPTVLAEDLQKMFGKGGPAFGVVPGKTGY